MDFALLISLGSLIVGGILALMRYREYRRDSELARRAGVEQEVKAPAERDSIIIGGAQQAVQMLRDALTTASLEAQALRARLDDKDAVIKELTARVTFLEHEIARLSNERDNQI